MKERPILFSAPMVRALLEGRKTQTRRLVKPQPTETPNPFRGDVGFEWPSTKARSMVDVRDMGALSPYGVVGDRLWVKETHRFEEWSEHGCAKVNYVADNAVRHDVFVDVRDFDDWSQRQAERWKRAGAELLKYDEEVGDDVEADESDCGESCWLQMPSGKRAPVSVSIHMPRWASRITLDVTGVRVERLQDISEEDAIAEGCAPTPSPSGFSVMVEDGGCFWQHVDHPAGPPVVGGEALGQRIVHVQPVGGRALSTARDLFTGVWRSINGEDSWAANLWVWVVEFAIAEVRR